MLVANMAARAAAAKPRLPTPAIPAAPPVLVSISTMGGEPSGGVPSTGECKGEGCIGGGRRLAVDGAR